MKKKLCFRWLTCLLMLFLLAGVEVASAAEQGAALPDGSESPVIPGTYLLIAYADREYACNISITQEEAEEIIQKALSYYQSGGTCQCIVVNEDQTARQYWDYGYLSALFEDGYFYTIGGERYVTNGPFLAIGYEETAFDWSVYCRLSPEQAAMLSYPEEDLLPGCSPLQIPLHSDEEYSALMDVVSPVLDAGGDPHEVYDEVLLAIDKVNASGEELLEEKLQDEAMWQQGQIGFAPEQFETFEETQMTMARIMQLNEGAVPVGIENGQVTFIGGSCTAEPVEDIWDAYDVLQSMLSLLGGNETFEFEPWGVLEDSLGNQYYTFQQFKNAVSVSGGAVKIAVNNHQEMTGIFSSIVTDLPQEEPEEVPYTELQDIVRENSGFEHDALTFLEGSLDVTLLPLILDPDPENDEQEESTSVRYVWIVYTDNPSVAQGTAENYPYLAHYITMEGEYLYHTAVIAPGDPAAVSGFSAEYTFMGMESDSWSGTLTFPDGTTQTVTLPVMKDSETGAYYLADPERRIVLADCYDFMYNDYQVSMISSENNEDWNPYYLGLYYNMIRVWDFYRETGWNGADGEDTPILVMVDYCDKEHEPVDNAAYMGLIHGWQTFGFSNSNVYGMALDVVAHEFTHCVTTKSMTFNSYLNDYGAINEAISDIMGNICESICEDAEDPSWLIAEDAAKVLRSMSEPHLYSMPEAVWDRYYVPHVGTPTDANDRGGVHINSSILNRIAYRLWTEGGMSLEESRNFWTSTECAMVPGTNFCQLSIVLPWVMDEIGLGQYTTFLKECIEDARLAEISLPADMDENEALIILELPENEVFSDGYWLLYLMDLELFGSLAQNGAEDDPKFMPIYEFWAEPEYEGEGSGGSVDLDALSEENAEEEPEKVISGDDAEEENPEEEEAEEEDNSFLSDLMKKQFAGTGTDNHTIRMMTDTGDKMLLLLHLSEENVGDPEIMLILADGVWKPYTLPGEEPADASPGDVQAGEEDPFRQSNGEIYTLRPGYNVLPTTGLDAFLP